MSIVPDTIPYTHDGEKFWVSGGLNRWQATGVFMYEPYADTDDHNTDGIAEDRIEEPYATWYSTEGGSIGELWTLYPHLETEWTAGSYGQTGTWWAVIRDRRGGMAWIEQQWAVGRGVAGG